ncbi:hypothetical protein ACFWYA_05935 [Streptomyces sp. NPDC059011]|uniref:hypothetical protein n=1 Tax=unclassified Streptomyces TaxID=2593676 RepID=UPI0036C8CA24
MTGQVHFQRRPGDPLVLPSDGGDMFTARLGYLITTGPTAQSADARAESALGRLTTRVEPAPTST